MLVTPREPVDRALEWATLERFVERRQRLAVVFERVPDPPRARRESLRAHRPPPCALGGSSPSARRSCGRSELRISTRLLRIRDLLDVPEAAFEPANVYGAG